MVRRDTVLRKRLAHQGSVRLAPRVERPLMVGKSGVLPTRLRVPEKDECSHIYLTALRTAPGARRKAHRLFRGTEEGRGLAYAFRLLAFRDRIGDDTGAGLHIHGPILHHRGPEYDAGIHLAIRGEIADAAGIKTALLVFELVDDFHSPHLRRTGHGAGGKARHQGIDGVALRIDLALNIRNDMHDLAVIF